MAAFPRELGVSSLASEVPGERVHLVSQRLTESRALARSRNGGRVVLAASPVPPESPSLVKGLKVVTLTLTLTLTSG